MPDFLSAPSLSSILGFAAGVGYCALVRAPLIEHNFDFTQDYKFANPKFRDQRNGLPSPDDFHHKIGGIEGRRVATAD